VIWGIQPFVIWTDPLSARLSTPSASIESNDNLTTRSPTAILSRLIGEKQFDSDPCVIEELPAGISE
jgi:hypothetical protein